ncbi:MAG: flavodoxin [Sphaerochaetaceae bacterium]
MMGKEKRWIILLLFSFLLFPIGCKGTSESESSASVENTALHSSDAEVASPAFTESESKILIAYFSRTGNTEQIATLIHDYIGGELFKIEPAVPYDAAYSGVSAKAQEEQRNNARPELATQVEDMDSYDIVFIGHPIWWGDAPMMILSFLEEYDLSGKIVIPFCTYGSSGSGRSPDSISSAAKGATVLNGFSCRGADAARAGDDVVKWLDTLGIFD